MKRGLTPFSRKGDVPPRQLIGSILMRAFVPFVVCIALTRAQPPVTRAAQTATEPRANELWLAGLRPGRSKLSQAVRLNSRFQRKTDEQDSQTQWFDVCRDISLTIYDDNKNGIRVIRVGAWGGSTADCSKMPPGTWKTGRGLWVGDPASKVSRLYGKPDSKSPSTRDGQPLELWYYAFDWAGPDVPQVMEVVCTPEKDGKPGQVVEITLAASSL